MILDFFISILAFVVVISVVVFVHEFGHYLIAKLNGVKIESFSIGFGKEIFSWIDKSGTRWLISWLPFGGYVKMFGDKDASSSSRNVELVKSMSDEDKKKCLQFKSPLVKISVAFAGPFFNFLLAIAILIPLYSIKGMTTIKPIITEIIKNSPAEKYDFNIGDEVLEVNNKNIETFDDVRLLIALSVDDSINFKIRRNEEIVYKNVSPVVTVKKDIFGNEIKINFVGIASNKLEFKKLSFIDSIYESVGAVYNMCKTTLTAVWQMITLKRGTDGLSGPIKIAKYSGQYFKNGIVNALMFIVLISTSLGVMNLLPIPILDGGLIFLCIVEILFRKQLSERCEKYVSTLGYVVLVILMVFATVKDIKDVIFG